MSNETPTERETRTTPDTRQLRWLWTGGSALGTLVGAVLALTVFPSAAFGRHPTGQFGWNLVGFALAIGVPFGLSQWLILRHVLKHRIGKNGLFLHLWIPVTSVGVAVMILPLWWWNATVFMWMPLLAAYPMFPGMVLLGITQWLLLYRLISGRFTWALLTIVGAAIGSIFGVVAAVLLIPIPPDLMWSLITGAGIGFFQAIGLVSSLRADRSRLYRK